jgi:hypothetical protein
LKRTKRDLTPKREFSGFHMELLAELRATCVPLCAERDAFHAVLAEIQKWFELTDKAHKMEIDDRMRMKFYMCLRIWKIRNEAVPSGEESWAQWFDRMYHQDIETFAKIAKEQDYRKKVMDYEVARFGWSPLETKAEAA